MKVTLTFTAVFFMLLKRSVSGASLPHFAGVTLFPLPYGTLPSLPSGGLPHLPDDTWPSLPGGTLPQLPGITLPQFPGGTLPSLPSGGLPHLPDDTWPSIPGGTLPQFPGGTLPQFPGGTLPHFPNDTLPSLPGGILPQFPGGTLPSLPGGILPQFPGGTLPRFRDDTLPQLPGGTLPQFPGGTWPQFPDDTLPSLADDASSHILDAPTLPSLVDDASPHLLDEFPTVSAQPITDAQRCVNTYNTSTLIDVANAGVDIIQAVSIPGHGIHMGLANQLQEQFIANISRCSALEALDNRFNCYDLQISNLRQSIATANNGSGLVHRLKILVVLSRLAKNLAKKYERLQQCLSLVLASTTPELQTTTTDSILSVLNTALPSIS